MVYFLLKPILKLLLLFLTVWSLSLALDNSDFTKIVGGKLAKPGKFPYIVSLQNNTDRGKNVCGGGIIAHYWILTAAHCVINIPPKSIVAYAGSVYLDKGGKYYRIRLIKIHENFNYSLAVNDIALLKTRKFIPWTAYIHFIHLPSKFDDAHPGNVVTAMGWGDTETPSENVTQEAVPNQLRYVRSRIVAYEVCAAAIPNYTINADTNLCFGGRAGYGTCRGDSGAPLVLVKQRKPIVVGIVSWGIVCAIGKPDIFTKVSHFVRWIQTTMTAPHV